MINATHSDGRLLHQIRDGDVSALGAMYDRYRQMVFHTALAITRDQGVAEEILQQCFLQMHLRASELDADQPIAPWLYRIVVDLSRARITQRASWWTPVESVLDRFDRLVGPKRSPADAPLNLRDMRAGLQHAIESIPFNQRIVLILYYLGGLTLKEIAFVLDRPLGTVKSRLHYGRELLRQRLIDARAAGTVPGLEVAHDLAA